LGIGLLGFDASRERAQNGLRIFELIRRALQPDQRSHTRKQVFFPHRSVQKIVRACFCTPDSAFDVAESGQKHNGHGTRFHLGLDGPANRESGTPWQFGVEQN
jgi:hypothetical protein